MQRAPPALCMADGAAPRWACYQEHRGVSKLSFADRGPVTGVDLSVWDSKSLGCVLPEDLKALLQITDGLTLKWDANLHGASAG